MRAGTSSSNEGALFVAEGNGVYTPTELTRGPWSNDAQHGGPIAALLSGLVEDTANERGFAVVRITFELIRPLPLHSLQVTTRSIQSGNSTDRVAAEVTAVGSGELLATAAALRLRRKPTRLPPMPPEFDVPLAPEHAARLEFPARNSGLLHFTNDAVEMRLVAGKGFLEPGPATVWFRLSVPVIEGQQVKPIQRMCAAADFGNGISSIASMQEMIYINPDLTVAILRQPVGDWVCLDSVTRFSESGAGGAESRLYDQQGRCGLAYQSLLVSSR